MPGRVPHLGDLARAASRRGDAGIDINYGHGGIEPDTEATFVTFGVAEADKAVKILSRLSLPARLPSSTPVEVVT